MVGEAGPFLDPFYSPGSDYIAMANTFTTDLVTRELDGEDVTERAAAHDDFYLSAFRVHLALYEGQYEFWHNPLVMNVKIGGNNILYWGVYGLLFFHRKLADAEFMASVRPEIERIWAITRRLEAMYREWNRLESREWTRAMVPTSAFPAMFERHLDMEGGFDDETLKEKIACDRGPDGGLCRCSRSTAPRPRCPAAGPGKTSGSTRTRSASTPTAGSRTA